MKIIDDILKINNKFSLKRVLVAITFPITMALGIFIVISDKYLDVKTVNIYAIQVFNSLLLFISVLVGVNAYAKKIEFKTENNKSKEDE
jgi:hypothetical protein